MAELMHRADLVIASPGLSAFEALYVGTPILLIPQNIMQKEAYQGLLKIIDGEEVNCLMDIIASKDFTYPNQEDIINMKIGKGKEELAKKILGDER